MTESDNDSNLEILDVENYRDNKNLAFSHQALVMKIMNRSIDCGSKEMRTGYFNEKNDKFGNKVLIYNPDTRKEFIEAVKTAEMVMVCDFDKTCLDNITHIKEELNKEYKKLVDEEKEDWNDCPVSVKRNRWSNGIYYKPNSLNTKLPFYQEYLEFELECYRRIFAELTLLTKRLDFYQVEDFEV